MIFADKVIRLRKKNGWSQEELADKVGVSRQAVSKWEGAQTVPDLSKILQLAQLFGVTTDYLLKDEIENEEFTAEEPDSAVKKVTLAEANEFLEQRRVASKRIAFATYLCILAPIPMLLLGAASENPSFPLSENLAGGIGLISLFIIAAVAVSIFIFCGFRNSPYEFLEKEPFDLEYGVRGMVQERMKAYHDTYVKSTIIGTVVCLLSPIALFVGMFSEQDMFVVVMLTITMAIAGIGVVFFIVSGVRNAAMQKLLKEGDYSVKEREKNELLDTVSGIYWLVAVAIYLAWSFMTQSWHTTWIVWPVAGVIYAVVASVCSLLVKNKEK